MQRDAIQLQGDEIPLIGDLLPFGAVFLVGAFVMYLGAVVSVMHGVKTFQEVRKKVLEVPFWASYATVLIIVVAPAAYVASVGIVEKGAGILVAAAVSFFSTGLSLEQRAAQAIAQAKAAGKPAVAGG